MKTLLVFLRACFLQLRTFPAAPVNSTDRPGTRFSPFSCEYKTQDPSCLWTSSTGTKTDIWARNPPGMTGHAPRQNTVIKVLRLLTFQPQSHHFHRHLPEVKRRQWGWSIPHQRIKTTTGLLSREIITLQNLPSSQTSKQSSAQRTNFPNLLTRSFSRSLSVLFFLNID